MAITKSINTSGSSYIEETSTCIAKRRSLQVLLNLSRVPGFTIMRLNFVTVLLSVFPLATASPLGALGLASWDVEGFAKDNPVGTTTGGRGGATVTVSSPAEFSAAVAGDTPKVVLVKGEIALPARPKIGSNKSVIGVGSTAHITNKGLDVFNSTNVIIQNLKISFIKDNDCITIRNSTRVWVDHNEFASDISQGPDAFVSTIFPCPSLRYP